MYRLIYKSRCKNIENWSMLREIHGVSEENNSNDGITGALLSSKTHFLQVLEGKFDTINKAFYKICKDERHCEVQIISFGPTNKRLFEHWGMKGIGVFDFNNEMAEALKLKYGEEEGGVKFPTEEWAVLALMNDIKLTRN